MAKIDTLFMTKTAKKTIPFGASHTYVAHIREYPPPRDCVSFQSFSLNDPSQPPPFSMPSKLLILHGEAKSYCFTVSYVHNSMFNYL